MENLREELVSITKAAIEAQEPRLQLICDDIVAQCKNKAEAGRNYLLYFMTDDLNVRVGKLFKKQHPELSVEINRTYIRVAWS